MEQPENSEATPVSQRPFQAGSATLGEVRTPQSAAPPSVGGFISSVNVNSAEISQLL